MKRFILAISIIAIAFSSCKKEKDAPSAVIANIILKDTTYLLSEVYIGIDSQWHSTTSYKTMVFSSDGSVTYTNYDRKSPFTTPYISTASSVSFDYFSGYSDTSYHSTFTVSNTDTAIVLTKTDYPYKIHLKR